MYPMYRLRKCFSDSGVRYALMFTRKTAKESAIILKSRMQMTVKA